MNYEQELTEFETWLNKSKGENHAINDWKIIIDEVKKNFNSDLRKIIQLVRLNNHPEIFLKLQPDIKRKQDLSFDNSYRILWNHQRIFWAWEGARQQLAILVKNKLTEWTKLIKHD